MDRKRFKTTPQTLVKDARSGEIKKIIHPADTEIGTDGLPSDLTVHGEIIGSIQQTSEGLPYLVAGTNIQIASGTNGQVTISASGAAGAPSTIAYVTIGNSASLSAERALAVGTGLRLTDGGSNASVTLDVKDNVYASLTGSNSFSGTATFSAALSGSIQRTSGGVSYLVAGTNITITSASNGQVTIASTGGTSTGGGDPNPSYLTLALTASLANERVFTPGTGLKATDAGANGAYTLRVDDGVFATISGSTFTGPVIGASNGGFTGSLTKLTGGMPFITVPTGNAITITTGSLGQIILSGSRDGTVSNVQNGANYGSYNDVVAYSFRPSTQSTTYVRAGMFEFDPSIVKSAGTGTRTIMMRAIGETTGPLMTIQLYNVTANAIVTNSSLTTNSLTSSYQVTGDLSSYISTGSAIYELQMKMASGGTGADYVALTYGGLRIQWN